MRNKTDLIEVRISYPDHSQKQTSVHLRRILCTATPLRALLPADVVHGVS